MVNMYLPITVPHQKAEFELKWLNNTWHYIIDTIM